MHLFKSLQANKKLRIFWSFAVTVIFSQSLFSPALSIEKTLKNDLNKLEIRFFEHKYPNDDDEKRIERIEKLVFGEAKTGSDDERITALLATVPELKNPTDNSQSKSSTQPQQQQDTQTASDLPDPSVDYPRVDAIEQVMLGKTFKNESLGKRLDQLELKAFKKSNQTCCVKLNSNY